MISFLYCQARSVRASLDQLTFNPFNPFNPFNTHSFENDTSAYRFEVVPMLN